MVTTLENTITVNGHFGEKHVTREDFVNQWIDHVRQIKNIDWSVEWLDECDVIIERVTVKAGLEFDRIFTEENK